MSAFSDAVMALGPLAYYRLDEVSGTVANDSSGNGYNGTIHGATLGVPGLLPSDPTDTAMGFGGNAYISLPGMPWHAQHTVVVIWKQTNAGKSNPIVNYENLLYLAGDNRYEVTVSTWFNFYDGQGGPDTNLPVFLAMVGNVGATATATLSKNGSPLANMTAASGGTSVLGGGRASYIGYGQAYGYGPVYATGVIDEVVIFPYQLSQAQIDSLASAAGFYNAITIGAASRIANLIHGALSIAAASSLSRTTKATISGAAHVLQGAATKSINAFAAVRQHSMRSINAAARILSSVLSKNIDAGAHISAEKSQSIGAQAFLVPAITSITIGAASFVVPETLKVVLDAASWIGGIGQKILTAAARIGTHPSTTQYIDRKVTVEPVERITMVSVEYREDDL